MEHKLLDLDPFAFRQFDQPDYSGSRFPDISKFEFINKVNEFIKDSPLLDGYAPMCKHYIIKNFTTTSPGAVKITEGNRKLIESGYASRRAEELPVLTRWIQRAHLLEKLKPAKYLDLILYSKKQIRKENEAMGLRPMESLLPDLSHFDQCELSDYSIISIKAQDVDYELPMQPITMMRNCLISEGGSGVPMDRENYKKAVDYWSFHVELK